MNKSRKGRTLNSGVDGSIGTFTMGADSSTAGGSTCAISAIASRARHDRMMQSSDLLHSGSFRFLEDGESAGSICLNSNRGPELAPASAYRAGGPRRRWQQG